MWIVGALGSLAGVAAVVVGIGALLPRDHVAFRSIILKQPLDAVWPVIADISAWPSWNKGLKRVERQTDRDGHAVFMVEDSNGPLPSEVLEQSPPPKATLVTRILDAGLPFGGTWTWKAEPVETGVRVTITENGSVYNPFFRFMSKFVFGHYRNMDSYLKALGQRFGESVEPG